MLPTNLSPSDSQMRAMSMSTSTYVFLLTPFLCGLMPRSLVGLLATHRSGCIYWAYRA